MFIERRFHEYHLAQFHHRATHIHDRNFSLAKCLRTNHTIGSMGILCRIQEYPTPEHCFQSSFYRKFEQTEAHFLCKVRRKCTMHTVVCAAEKNYFFYNKQNSLLKISIFTKIE